jgi:hypothetical protein
MNSCTRACVASMVAIAGFSAAANAENVIASFTYDDLSGGFTRVGDPGNGIFRAAAVSTTGLRSSGDVSRLVPGYGTASFADGFTSLGGSAGFNVDITVMQIGPGLALGSGQFVCTDLDGDTITGSIAGSWYSLPGQFIAFNGALENVTFNDNGRPDDSFDGTTGGFQMSGLPGTPPYTGAYVQLTFGAPSFFQNSFAGRATGVTGQILPTPGCVALLGLGGLTIARRRR